MATAGYLLVYVGWPLGTVALVLGLWSVPVVLRSSPSTREAFYTTGCVGLVAGAVLVLASLALPWLRGVGMDGRSVIELRGAESLDPFSLVFVAVAAVAMAGLPWLGRSPTTVVDGGGVLVCLATCVNLVVVGNLFIRLGEPGPTAIGGFGVGTVVSLVPVAGAVLMKSAETPQGAPHGG